MRRLHLVAALGLYAACTGHETPALDPHPPTPPAEPTAQRSELVPERPPPAQPEVVEVPLSAIGYPGPPEISGKARAKNRAALKLHHKGDYVASRVGFEEALEASPDHDMARFNLACALARLGELDAARGELRTVLHRDLLRFQGRWRGPDADADLEALRTSPHAPELDALIVALRTAYDAAHEDGVAAYLYRDPPTMAETDFGGKPSNKGSSSLISGAWLHAQRRFVPLARGGTVALLDLHGRRVLRAEVSRDEMHCHWNVYADEALISTDPDPNTDPPGAAYDGASEPQENEYEPPDHPSLHIVDDDPDLAVSTWIDVRPYGGVYQAPEPQGYALSRKRLTVPTRDQPLKLDRNYDTVFATSDPDAPVFLLDRRSNDSAFDATVSRLDPTTGDIERIAGAPGNAWVTIGPDDSVYVEIGDEVKRWPTPGADAPEPTMPGLHITMPFGGPSCMCCG